MCQLVFAMLEEGRGAGVCTVGDDNVRVGEQALPFGSRADIHRTAHDDGIARERTEA